LRYWAFEELSTHSRSHWSGNTFNGDFWRNGSGQLDPTWMVSSPLELGGSYFLASPVPFENAELPTYSTAEARTRVLQKGELRWCAMRSISACWRRCKMARVG
jgi:hypothetical protein